MSVYYSLVYSHLQYAIICWGNSSKTIKHRLQVKQNCIIKTLSNKFGTTIRLKPLYEQLQVLNIDKIYKLEVAKFMAKVNLNKLPVFLCNQRFLELCLLSIRTRPVMFHSKVFMCKEHCWLKLINRLTLYILGYFYTLFVPGGGQICPPI